MTNLNALTQLAVKNHPAGKYADGQGLWLVKRSKEQGRWMLRISIGVKEHAKLTHLVGNLQIKLTRLV